MNVATASWPLEAVCTRKPAGFNLDSRELQISCSSSTIRIDLQVCGALCKLSAAMYGYYNDCDVGCNNHLRFLSARQCPVAAQPASTWTTPLRIIITAIAAKKSAMILDNALAPERPKIFIKRSDQMNITPTRQMFSTTETTVAATPCWSIMIKDVVNTAGPTINGVPRGPAPSSSERFGRSFHGCNRSLMERHNKITPPAIIKSHTVIPTTWNIHLPRTIKATASERAVATD